MSSNIISILTYIALVCSGVLLRDWVAKLVTSESFNSSVKDWVHNFTKQAKDCLDRWFSTIMYILVLLMSVVLYTILSIRIENIAQDKLEGPNMNWSYVLQEVHINLLNFVKELFVYILNTQTNDILKMVTEWKE